MPLYEFECPDCKKRYEKQITVADFEGGRHCCPACGGKGKNIIFPVATHMKYSNMHVRHMRGQKGKQPKNEGRVME